MNPRLQTSDPDIYAIGDAVEVKDYVHGFATHVPLAWPANRQGRLVADIIHGFDVYYTGTLGTAIVKLFGMTVAATGNSEKPWSGWASPLKRPRVSVEPCGL